MCGVLFGACDLRTEVLDEDSLRLVCLVGRLRR